MLRSMTLAILLAMTPVAALAHMCPSVMAEIDAALPAATLSEADMATVTELRATGEELHNAGDHDGSIAALEEAKALLGM
ncbi:hypothetical protein [Nitratireductor soli]|uniref:hypothetical protein n=1 Tax=Nitratireductor soli TaxID=1670619 RepID=UPI00065DF2D8|nr:hypothetical protein [Nitratireductor soli]